MISTVNRIIIMINIVIIFFVSGTVAVDSVVGAGLVSVAVIAVVI